MEPLRSQPVEESGALRERERERGRDRERERERESREAARACVNGMRVFLTEVLAVARQLSVWGIDVSRASAEEVQGVSRDTPA